MNIGDIRIYPCFAAHTPRVETMEPKEWLYAESGLQEFGIILDHNNNLVDGYCGYLLAKRYGLTHVPVRYGRRQTVRASHRPGGKLYSWELPGILVGRVRPGDRVMVETSGGHSLVTVAQVEEYSREAPEPLRMVIRRLRRSRKSG